MEKLMRVLKARRLYQQPSAKGFHTLAKFNLQVNDDVLICDCSLVQAPDKRVLLYGPGAGNSLSVSPMARHHIVEMAMSALGLNPNAAAAV
jgi:hypothetical protein